MKTILIFGGTGFIGRHLIEELLPDYKIIVFSRNPEKQQHALNDKINLVSFDYSNPSDLVSFFDEADAIINLAGENVGEKWTTAKKQAIKSSRLNTDRLIIDVFNQSKIKPNVIIQGSGMGVYGFEPSQDKVTEKSPLGKKGFLTQVGIEHEKSMEELKTKTRLIYLRTGLVLDKNEGALPPMAMPFKLFVGGKTGDGNHWVSWIHIKDEVKAIRFLLENQKTEGAYNLTAPNPVMNKAFAKELGKALRRPAFFKTPSFILKSAMGEMAEELLLSGLKIVPERLLQAGFRFQFEHLKDALKDIYR